MQERDRNGGLDEPERVSLWSQMREMAHILAPAALVIIAAFWFASRFVEPAPPKSLTIATGGSAGAYFGFGKRYAEALAKSGIRVEVLSTAGSVENAKLLADTQSGVSVALLQGGIADSKSLPHVVSLGRVFLEPVWIFHRAADRIERLADLRGRKLAVGVEGSGTRALAEALLKPNDAVAAPTVLLPLSGAPALESMARGDADAVVLVMAPDAAIVQSLLRDDRFKLMGLQQAEAYSRLFPYLTKVVLPQGVIDLARNIPDQDVPMVAASAALVAQADLHPALVGLLVDAARNTHAGGNLLYKAGEFPKSIDPEFPMSEDAERVYKAGQSFLKRVLPFWLATFIERMIVMIVPIAGILLPLTKAVPLLYQWRIKRRIYYWYEQLKKLERRVNADRDLSNMEAHRAEADRIDAAVTVIPVPIYYSEQLFSLRNAVGLVRQRIYALS
jgi:TRAP transporter TAXI family solute receptor